MQDIYHNTVQHFKYELPAKYFTQEINDKRTTSDKVSMIRAEAILSTIHKENKEKYHTG